MISIHGCFNFDFFYSIKMIFLKRFKRFIIYKQYNHGNIRATTCLNQICQAYLIMWVRPNYVHLYFKYDGVFLDMTIQNNINLIHCCIKYSHNHTQDRYIYKIRYSVNLARQRLTSYQINDSPNITHI